MKPFKIDKRKKQFVAPEGSLKWNRKAASKVLDSAIKSGALKTHPGLYDFLLEQQKKAKLRDVDPTFACTMAIPKKRHRLISKKYAVVVDCPQEHIDMTTNPPTITKINPKKKKTRKRKR